MLPKKWTFHLFPYNIIVLPKKLDFHLFRCNITKFQIFKNEFLRSKSSQWLDFFASLFKFGFTKAGWHSHVSQILCWKWELLKDSATFTMWLTDYVSSWYRISIGEDVNYDYCKKSISKCFWKRCSIFSTYRMIKKFLLFRLSKGRGSVRLTSDSVGRTDIFRFRRGNRSKTSGFISLLPVTWGFRKQ